MFIFQSCVSHNLVFPTFDRTEVFKMSLKKQTSELDVKLKKVIKNYNNHKKKSLTIRTSSDKGSTYFPVTFKTSSGGPVVILNPG